MPDWGRIASVYRAQELLERTSLAAIVDLGRPGIGDVVVDLGCGPGTLARHLHRIGRPVARVIGVDASTEMLRRAAATGTHPVAGDVGAVPLPGGVGDLVVASFVLHLLDDHLRDEALHEVSRLLAPGGRAVFATPAEPRSRRGRMVRAALRATVAPRTLRVVDLQPSIRHSGLVVTAARHVGEGRVGYCAQVLRVEGSDAWVDDAGRVPR